VTTHLAVTLASKGQFTALAASSSGRNFYVQFNLNITGYDQTLHIAAPPARLVQPLTKQLLTKALGSGGSSYAKLFSPQGIATLGQIRLG
jgi:hypothetical protein